MRKLAALAGATALGLGFTSAHAFTATASVTFNIGGSTNGAGADQGFVSSAGPLPIGGSQPTNATSFHTLAGANSTSHYNSNYAVASDCTIGGAIVPGTATSSATRKYGCRYNSALGTSLWEGLFPVPDAGPVAQAAGTISVTDTTMTGTLTIVNTSDEPTGATTINIIGTTGTPGTTRSSNSIGDGFAGFNYRTADGSPFGSAWYGITNAGTYTLNLGGTFNNTTWIINSGTATFTDPGYACQQGGFGGDLRGTLCTSSVTGGGFNPDGSHLSWGLDKDAIGPLGPTPIELRDTGGVLLATLSGAIANMSIAVNGTITTNSGEVRRGLGNSSGCPTDIRYDTGTNMLSCGSITSGALVVTGLVGDSDGDTVRDNLDNCTNTGNLSQLDSNGDGYGNFCDADLNNSGLTTSTDFNLLRSVLNQSSGSSALAAAADMNGSGLVTSTDFNLLRARLNQAPGPSALH